MAYYDEKALEAFTNLMVDKMNAISNSWQQPWLNRSGTSGMPQNIDGRTYNGMNMLMLYMLSEKMDYKLPVFLTFNQARQENVSILKGEQSFPVVYWNFYVKDKETGEKISMNDYNSLSAMDQEQYIVSAYQKHYNVFNVQQTNIEEKKPDLWKSLQDRFKIEELKDESGMFMSPKLDSIIQNQTWVTPIYIKEQDHAFYSPSKDTITVPLKGQFKNGESFYSTLLHEMAHSTGHESRLKREFGGVFGSSQYGREELVAELTSAVTGQSIGISTAIREENAKYLKGWLENINADKSFLFTVLSDVNKASAMVMASVENAVVKEKEIEIVKDNLSQKEINDLIFMQQTGSFQQNSNRFIAGVDFNYDMNELSYALKNFKNGLNNEPYIYDIHASIRMKAGTILEEIGIIDRGLTKETLIAEGYIGKFVHSLEETQKAINLLSDTIREKIQEASLRIAKADADTQNFEAYIYNHKMEYAGKVSAIYDMKELGGWKLYTDTTNALLPAKEDVDFVRKNMYGAAIKDGKVEWRSVVHSADLKYTPVNSAMNENNRLASGDSRSTGIYDIKIFPLNEGRYAITAKIFGEEQAARTLDHIDVKAFFEDKSMTTIDLGRKYYADELQNGRTESKGLKI